MSYSSQRGLISPLIIVTALLALIAIGTGIFAFWAYINYIDYRDNADQKIKVAVDEATLRQSQEDQSKFAEQEKLPTRKFVGPEDLGRVQFDYPKTWSVYVENDGSSGRGFDAYLHPGIIHPLSNNSPYALRLSIENEPYESALRDFETAIKDGKIRSSTTVVNGQTGIRLEGAIDTKVDGIMVLLKLRDKTIKVYTETRSAQTDFDTIIMPSLSFNP